MLRELILFSADLTATKWYAEKSPPAVEMPSFVEFEVVKNRWPDSAVPKFPEFGNTLSRLQRGDECIIGRTDDSGDIVYCLWVSSQTTYLDWIFGDVKPLPDHALLYNAWVKPEYRGQSLHWAGAAAACGHLASSGRTHFCAGVERGEFKPFASKYAQMGLIQIAPYASLWGLKMFGKAIHVMRPARKELAAMAQDLRQRHSALFVDQS